MAESGNEAKKISTLQLEDQKPPSPSPLKKIIAVAALATGINFGWSLQLSLLTPYVQLLGIPHKWASFIWLCGPISGILVQPIVGFHSDRCTSRFGRRRPFIAAGAISIILAVFLIGYAADIGHMSGDSLGDIAKPRAIAVFVVGFWIFDVANNMLQGPCRAFLGDLSAANQKTTRTANAFFSFFMAIGNVLGYASGSYSRLYKVFPFALTEACDVYCANLKSCFFIDVIILIILATVALFYVKDPVWSPEKGIAAIINGDEKELEPSSLPPPSTSSSAFAFFGELVEAFKTMKRPMLILLLVTGLTMFAWFPFMLFDTDWVGREVYGGDSSSNGNDHLTQLYGQGVRVGTLGLLLNSVILMIASLGVERTGRLIGGAKRLWGIVNLILAVFLGLTILISKLAESNRRFTTDNTGLTSPLPPSPGIKASTLALFSIMGVPLAVTYSVPYALASIFSNDSGAGQGLSMGVLNLAVVIPQMIISLAAGQWDALFGGGNLPAFVVGALAAVLSGVLALTVLPSPPPDSALKPTTVASVH